MYSLNLIIHFSEAILSPNFTPDVPQAIRESSQTSTQHMTQSCGNLLIHRESTISVKDKPVSRWSHFYSIQ